MNDLLHINGNLAVDDRVARLMRDFLAGRRQTTLRAYQQALGDFQHFVGASDTTEAIRSLLGQGPGEANALALAYRNALVEAKLSAATVNLRLSALRAVTKLGRTCGLVSWALEIRGLRILAYRDVRGPGEGGFRRLLAEVARHDGALGAPRLCDSAFGA